MPRAELLETYHWLRDAPEDEPRYNIAPTDPVLAVGPHRAEVVRWGIEGSKGGLFNLRSESAEQTLLPEHASGSTGVGAGQPLL